MIAKAKSVCIIHGCGRTQFARGLCQPCYKSARRVIRERVYTAEQLESVGLMINSLRPRRGPFMTALESASKKLSKSARVATTTTKSKK
jgi:hypothetical protein